MGKSLALVFTAVMISTIILPPTSMAVGAQNNEPKHVPGQLLIRFNEDVPEGLQQAILRNHGAQVIDSIPQIDVKILKVPEKALGRIESALKSNSAVKYVEEDLLLEPLLVPDDPHFSNQWHLSKIQAPNGWDIGKGSPNISVAILDTGVDPNHPDLTAKLLAGYNFYDNNDNWSDVCGHGTKVAGAAAAITNNSLGVAAVAWENMILPIRITDTNCFGHYSTLAKGIIFAADMGSKAANISFQIFDGGTLTDAAKYMYSKGGWVVAGAGNTGKYESYSDNPYIISVSATDSTDTITRFSSFGPYVDFSAPGSSIYTTVKGGSYGYSSGTSFSSAITAGLTALISSQNPSMTAQEVYDLLKNSALDLGTAGYDYYYGWGRVDGHKAMQLTSSIPVHSTAPPTLTVTKIVTNDNGGTLTPSDFPLFIDGSPVASAVPNIVSAGAHTVSETSVAGYTSSISGDCASDGSITLLVGDVKSCTITNDDIPGTLIVIKSAVNDNGGTAVESDFTITVSGNSPSPSSFPGSALGTTVTLNAGSYSVTESPLAGYSSSLSADCSGTISVGETKSCTITNDDIPPGAATLTVLKVVINDNGGTLGVSDFALFIDGSPVTSGVPNIVSVGSHTVSETSVPGYTSTITGDCAADGSITLSVDGFELCIIMNDDIPTLASVSTSGETVTFSTSTGSFSSPVISFDQATLTPPPPSVTFPFGMFGFTITGLPITDPPASVNVTITFPSPVPAGSQYWKFQNGQYFQMPAELIGSNDGDNILTLILTDGGIGDADGLVNGIIVDPGGPAPPVAVAGGTAGGCRSWTFTNDPTLAGRCTIVDTEPPKIVRAFVTPSDYLCVETHDNVQTVKVMYNGNEIPRWAGSIGYFCTNEKLPSVIKVVAEDIAGNKSEKMAINAQEILTTRTEQSFTAIIAKELNPHHGTEGIVLEAGQPMKQIRLAMSPDFSDRELYISEKGIKELNGKKTIEVIYKGQYPNQLYGKERHGQMYVFATNIGKLATFDIVVKNDIKLYPHQEKQRHGTYDLHLVSESVLDEMNLNAWQKAELERIFAGNEELTIVQNNIMTMVLRLAEDLDANYVGIAVIDAERGFTIAVANELNPHHGVEGIVLETDIPVKQIRLVSPDFSAKELYISEKGIMELDGKLILEVIYKGQYGKERYGQLYLFATNMGKIATFDVAVKDDIRLYLRSSDL